MMSDYTCPNCGYTIELVLRFPQEELPVVMYGFAPPPKLYAFCFECGEWVDFEKEVSHVTDV